MELESTERLTRDLNKAAVTLSKDEVRFLVDAYYQMQDNRIRAANQSRTLTESGEPHDVLKWLKDQSQTLEDQVRRALDTYSKSTDVGQWLRSITGIGPVIASGLEAHIDIRRAPSAGHIWNYAGLNACQIWMNKADCIARLKSYDIVIPKRLSEQPDADVIAFATNVMNRSPENYYRFCKNTAEGQVTYSSLFRYLSMRPWNADLKKLCFLIGESFVKQRNRESDVYGKLYSQRKALEIEMNDNLEFKELALEKAKKVGKQTEAYAHYKEGKLSPGHLHSRARRFAVKIFLSHYHYVAYFYEYGKEPPEPYAMEHLGHTDVIEVPNKPDIAKSHISRTSHTT